MPVVGPETHNFLQFVVPEASREDVKDAAVSILAKGVSPTAAHGQETGLVIGYVQSGKTMSFETAATLARDNGFQIVIVVAGIGNNLLEQSTGRLRRDFGLMSRTARDGGYNFRIPLMTMRPSKPSAILSTTGLIPARPRNTKKPSLLRFLNSTGV